MICFLVSGLIFNTLSSEALSEKENNRYNTNNFDRSIPKWNSTEVVSTESISTSHVPSLAIDSAGNVHIAWCDNTNYAGAGSDWDIFYKQWDTSTSSWSTTEIVSTESITHSYYPSLAVDSVGNVYVVWGDETDYAGAGSDRDIFYKRWNATSSSWTTTEVVSTESTGYSHDSSIDVDSVGNVHIAWEDWTDYAGAGTDNDIFYKRWNATSSSWTTTEVVSTESTTHSYYPSLAVDSVGNVYVVWGDDTNYAGAGSDRDIFYKRWDTSTSSWTTTEVVSTESTGYSHDSSIDVDSVGNVYIAWEDVTNYAGAGNDEDIFYKSWDVFSSAWTSTEVVSTESTGNSNVPSLAVDSVGNIHISWGDNTDYAGEGADEDIFYKSWDVFSSAWTSTEVVSTGTTGNSHDSSLAVDSVGNVYIAWCDNTDYAGAGSDWDIFYKFSNIFPIAPELAFIVPNPTDVNTIFLDWNNITSATSYFVYRNTYYIWSADELVPIAEVTTSFYVDTLPAEGYFYYVIVATNFVGNRSQSNCQYVEYKLPHVREFTLITGLILGVIVVSIVILRTRRTKLK